VVEAAEAASGAKRTSERIWHIDCSISPGTPTILFFARVKDRLMTVAAYCPACGEVALDTERIRYVLSNRRQR